MATAAKKQPRREVTEAKILDAFERTLLRDGANNISVMSVSREAGVAKTLIYKYYGGLVGLIKTWIDERHGWPDLSDLYGEDQGPAFDDNPLLYQKQSLRKMAEHLRKSPLSQELMVAELMGSGPVTEALHELRSDRLKQDSEILGQDLSDSEVRGKPSLRIFYAAMSYLVLRAKNSPVYMGTLQLDTDEGWNEVMADFENIFDDLIAFQEHLAISKQRLAEKDTAN
jgi:AcrR family transcriptional regulator